MVVVVRDTPVLDRTIVILGWVADLFRNNHTEGQKMKSKIHKGLKVASEIKPKVGLLSKDFVFTRGANLAEKFAQIRERQAAEKAVEVDNIMVMPKRGVK